MYQNFAEMASLARERGISLPAIILENEMEISEAAADTIYGRLRVHYGVMKDSAEKALHKILPIECPLIEGNAMGHYQYAAAGNTIAGGFVNLVMARALSCSEVNASMGKICAAPTAGASGILPAVLVTMEEAYGLAERAILDGLLMAAGIGAVVMTHATVSGAEGGCQAECGVAAAMAAAAAVHLRGGEGDVPLHAAAFALIHSMGLVCDPVAGLVQVPCAQRNASQAVNALISADLALAGMKSLLPLDEVVAAMYRVGRQMPVELRETAKGGIAASKTAKAVEEALHCKNGGCAFGDASR